MRGREDSTSRAAAIRAERKARNLDSLSGKRRRLRVTPGTLDPGYSHRWVNDEPGRVEDMKAYGWEVVSDRSGTAKPDGAGMGSEISARAGTQEGGGALRSVLMRIPREIYDDDQQAKARAIDETEADMKRGAVPGVGHAARDEGMYVKNISIERGS